MSGFEIRREDGLNVVGDRWCFDDEGLTTDAGEHVRLLEARVSHRRCFDDDVGKALVDIYRDHGIIQLRYGDTTTRAVLVGLHFDDKDIVADLTLLEDDWNVEAMW